MTLQSFTGLVEIDWLDKDIEAVGKALHLSLHVKLQLWIKEKKQWVLLH